MNARDWDTGYNLHFYYSLFHATLPLYKGFLVEHAGNDMPFPKIKVSVQFQSAIFLEENWFLLGKSCTKMEKFKREK